MSMHNATQRWLTEQEDMISEVDRLLRLYESASGPDHSAVVTEQP